RVGALPSMPGHPVPSVAGCMCRLRPNRVMMKALTGGGVNRWPGCVRFEIGRDHCSRLGADPPLAPRPLRRTMTTNPGPYESLLAALHLDERASLTAGHDDWTTEGLSDHGVPAIRVTDGPVGARGQSFTG